MGLSSVQEPWHSFVCKTFTGKVETFLLFFTGSVLQKYVSPLSHRYLIATWRRMPLPLLINGATKVSPHGPPVSLEAHLKIVNYTSFLFRGSFRSYSSTTKLFFHSTNCDRLVSAHHVLHIRWIFGALEARSTLQVAFRQLFP